MGGKKKLENELEIKVKISKPTPSPDAEILSIFMWINSLRGGNCTFK